MLFRACCSLLVLLLFYYLFMLDIRLVDFATWENARAMARADSVPDGLM